MHTASGIWYETEGAGEPILMLMGFGMRGLVWRPQVDDLKRDHTCAFYDNRGCGRTAAIEGALSMESMAGDALEVADTLGWERFHVVGISMGGMVAQELAIRHSDRLGSLTLIATQAGGPRAYLPPLRSLPRTLLIALGGERRRGRFAQRMLHPPGSLEGLDPALVEQRVEDAHGPTGMGPVRRQQLRAIRKHDTRERLHRIKAPTLVIQPAKDRLCRPEHAFTLVRGIPRARLLRLPDAGHGLVFHAAEAVNRAIRQHVGRYRLDGR